jgi:hypothetical protein
VGRSATGAKAPTSLAADAALKGRSSTIVHTAELSRASLGIFIAQGAEIADESAELRSAWTAGGGRPHVVRLPT